VVPAKTIHGAGKILTDSIFRRLAEIFKHGLEEIQEYFWDESRVLSALLVLMVFVVGALYLTGVFARCVPYVYLGAARFQTVFDGPGDPDETYTRILGIRPSWGEVYYRRGMLRETKGQREDALSDFEMASTLSVSSAGAYIAHGRVSTILGRFDQALWDFRTAMEKDPGNDRAYIERARLYLKTEKFEDALADFQKAVSLSPESVDGRIGVEEAKKGLEQARLKSRMSGE